MKYWKRYMLRVGSSFKLHFPFKPYSHEEVMKTHGDERNRILDYNDSVTYNNIILILFITVLIIFICW